MIARGIMLCMQHRVIKNVMSYQYTGSRIHVFMYFFFFGMSFSLKFGRRESHFWLICSPYRAAYFYPQLLKPFLPKDEIQLHLIIQISSFPVRLSPALRKSTSAYSLAPSLVITDWTLEEKKKRSPWHDSPPSPSSHSHHLPILHQVSSPSRFTSWCGSLWVPQHSTLSVLHAAGKIPTICCSPGEQIMLLADLKPDRVLM